MPEFTRRKAWAQNGLVYAAYVVPAPDHEGNLEIIVSTPNSTARGLPKPIPQIWDELQELAKESYKHSLPREHPGIPIEEGPERFTT